MDLSFIVAIFIYSKMPGLRPRAGCLENVSFEKFRAKIFQSSRVIDDQVKDLETFFQGFFLSENCKIWAKLQLEGQQL